MSTQSHAELFVRAVEAVVGAGPSDPGTLFTDDVHSWSPVLNVSSLAELSDAIHDRDESLSNVTVAVRALHSGGNQVMAEWRLDADHTGPFVVADDLTVPATGRHIHIGGATFADFRGDKISAFRSYFDEMALMEQLMGAVD
jgi:predicted ester cyclase